MHLKQIKPGSYSHMRLVNPQVKTIEEASQCAEMFSKCFRDQYCEDQQISDTCQLDTTNADLIEVTTVGANKLINSLPNGKFPFGRIYVPDLFVDVIMSALCLKHILQAAIDSGKLSME